MIDLNSPKNHIRNYLEDILNENDSHEVKIWPLLFGIIIFFYKLNDDKIFKEKLESFQNIHFVYDFFAAFS